MLSVVPLAFLLLISAASPLPGSADGAKGGAAAVVAQPASNPASPVDGVNGSASGGGQTAPGTAAGIEAAAPQTSAALLADKFTGATCDAKVLAAEAQMGRQSGIIQIGAGCGSTIAHTITLSANHSLQFVSSTNGTFELSAPIVLSSGGSIYGLPAASNTSIPITLQEAAGANLAYLVSMASGSTISNVRIDGNKANNPSGQDAVLINNANRIHILHSSIQNAERDDIHVTNTHYPAPTAGEALALNTILTINRRAQYLFKTTTAGTGTSSYPFCDGTLGSTCTWGTAVLTNIGRTYDDTSGDGYLGPDVLLSGSGRDAFFGERVGDWIIGTQVEFQSAGRDGLHCEDCATFDISGANIGANARYGIYKAVVNSQCSSGESSTGWTISATQFGNNIGGDIYENGSAVSSPSFCNVPGGPYAGGDSITGNGFDNPAASGVNSITFIDAGGNAVVGNYFGNLYFQLRYRYIVASSFSTLTGISRLASTIKENAIQPFSYSEAAPFSLTSGVDVACAAGYGAETCNENETINGSLAVQSVLHADGGIAVKVGGPAAAAQNGPGMQIIDSDGNFYGGAGTNIIYRCTAAGTLPIGALTIAKGNCGASLDTGLRTK